MKVRIGDSNNSNSKELGIDIINASNMPNSLRNTIKVECMTFEIITKIVGLILNDVKKIDTSININIIMNDLNKLIKPILNKFLFEMLSTNINRNTIADRLANIVFYYIELEYMFYSLPLETELKDYISEITFTAIFENNKS